MKTGNRWLTPWLLAAALAACGGDDATGDDDSTDQPDAAPAGYSLTLRASMKEGPEGKLQFLTPGASVVEHAKADVVGKPYYVAAFPAGFSPGNDAPIHDFWGEVPQDLKIEWTTPATYQNGGYDLILVIYVHSTITDAMKAGEELGPNPTGGDLSAFTFTQDDILPGEPELVPGTLRVKVKDAPVVREVWNKVPETSMDPANDTILILP
jgi:hypothetical protein